MTRFAARCRRAWAFANAALERSKALCYRVWVIGCRWTLLGACAVSGFALVNLGFAFPGIGSLVLAYAAWKRLHRWKVSGWLYGTARLGNFYDACMAGWTTNRNGLILGRASFTAPPSRRQALRLLADPTIDSRQAMRLLAAAFLRTGGNRLLRIHDYVHVAIFGSVGSGKGVGIVIPTLLSHFGSCVVADPKGENIRLTAAHRKKHGHTILCLDPFAITGRKSDSLNFLDLIDDTAADFPEQIGDLVEAMVIVTGKETQPHFPESARIILGCIIAYVCINSVDPEERSLKTVRYILQSRHRFNDAIVAMQQSTAYGGYIAGLGHQLTWYVEKELASIQSTITRHTAWLDSPAMQAITTTSTFDPRKFKTCKATLYLVLPSNRLRTLAPLMRMWISTMLRAQIEGVADERRKLLFILDEAAHLGHMQILEDAVTLMRGYGVRLMFFYQSIGQVSHTYGERASVFLDNIGTQLYFGVNAYESAEAISKRGGDASVLVESLNASDSFSRPTGGFSKDNRGSVSQSRALNYAEMGRPLFRPDEILRLHEEVGLLFHKNMPVIPVKLLRYYKEWEFRWGGSAPYRGGMGLRAGLLAMMALLASLMLLAVSFHLPAFYASQHAMQAARMEDVPPEADSVAGDQVVKDVAKPDPLAGWGPPRFDRSGSRRRVLTLPPYPNDPGIPPGQRQGAARGTGAGRMLPNDPRSGFGPVRLSPRR